MSARAWIGVTLAAVALSGCGPERPPRPTAEPENPRSTVLDQDKPDECQVLVGEGDDLAAVLADAPAGAVVCVAPGRHAANLDIVRSVTLRGIGAPGAAVLDGGRRGAVIQVMTDDIVVRVEQLTLVDGSAPQGGGVSLGALSRVELEACALSGHVGRQGPGGALFADQGTLVVTRCRVHESRATDGHALAADGIASVSVSDCLLVGEGGPSESLVRVHDGADLTIVRSTLVAAGGAVALHASGTSSRAPEVTISDSVIFGREAIDAPQPFPGKVGVARSILSAATPGTYADQGGTTIGAPGFSGDGDEPYRPRTGSAACGIAQGGEPDLSGRPRPAQGACAGAFEP